MTFRRTPVLGKHTKSITCGEWNRENILALGSQDQTVSISNIEGDTLKIISLRGEPSKIAFSKMKSDRRKHTEETVSYHFFFYLHSYFTYILLTFFWGFSSI